MSKGGKKMKKVKIILSLLLCLSCFACASETQTSTQSESQLIPGTYTAIIGAHNGDLTVEVTVSETGLTDVKVTDHQETYGIGYGSSLTPIEVLPKLMVENQTVNVDSISGATITSAAIKAAVTDCLNQANADETFVNKEAPHINLTESEYDVDIVVVGSGIAGLTAANTAKDEGKSVLLVEKLGVVGGSTVRSGGNIFAAGTQVQKANGIEDDAESLFNFLMSYNEDDLLNEAMVRDYAYGIADDMDYLTSNGVEFTAVISAHPTTLTPNRLHLVGPNPVIDAGIGGWLTVPLIESYLSKGGELLLETSATKLLVNENNEVVGIEASNKLDETVTIHAGAVILATGGYGANAEMTERFANLNIYWNTSIGNTGDGLIMAQEVGAQVFDSDGMQFQYVSYDTGETGSTYSGLVVDVSGNRVTNEHGYQSVTAEAFKREGSYVAYVITAVKDGVCVEPYATAQYGVTLDTVPHAESIEELAALINVDPATLAATVERYNELCEAGTDEDFGKPSEYMIPIEGDVYYAMPRYAVTAATFGGLVIDENGHVLNTSDEIIPNLYAAGEVALTGVFAKVYPSCGLAVGNSLHMGRKAALSAVNEE